jgi:hypothetical protein
MLRGMSPRSSATCITLVASVTLLAACRDAEVDRLTAIKDRVCLCTTSACADQALHEVALAPVEANRKTRKLAKDMLACVARAHEHDRPDDGSAAP